MSSRPQTRGCLLPALPTTAPACVPPTQVICEGCATALRKQLDDALLPLVLAGIRVGAGVHSVHTVHSAHCMLQLRRWGGGRLRGCRCTAAGSACHSTGLLPAPRRTLTSTCAAPQRLRWGRCQSTWRRTWWVGPVRRRQQRGAPLLAPRTGAWGTEKGGGDAAWHHAGPKGGPLKQRAAVVRLLSACSCAPAVQVEHFEQVLPLVLPLVGDSDPVVQERACYAMDVFCENMEREQILPYIPQASAPRRCCTLHRTSQRVSQPVCVRWCALGQGPWHDRSPAP